jgi:hypothetical protein
MSTPNILDPKIQKAFRDLEASVVKSMREGRSGIRAVPGEIAQQWHDEMTALSRRIGQYLDEIRYGKPPSDSVIAIHAARTFCEGYGITNEGTIAALAGLIESHRSGAARMALQAEANR